jgi:hypothetical protein
MEELCRLEIPGMSRAEFLDLKRRMPEGAVKEPELKQTGEELGVLEPITATVIVTLGLAGINVLGAWLIQNRNRRRVEYDRVKPNGEREHLFVLLDSETSEADVVEALTKNMPKAPTLAEQG